MTDAKGRSDRLRAFLVLLATFGTIVFNFLAASGWINGVTPEEISNKYLTPITPAGYTFTIWSLIYAGMIAFSVYQLLPSTALKFRMIRTLYILTCVLNCGWIYFWHRDSIIACSCLIILLAAVCFHINSHLKTTDTAGEYWLVKVPFGLYFGWVTAAALINLAVLFVYLRLDISPDAWATIAVLLILVAGVLAVVFRIKLSNYIFPLAIAWALTGIAVKQSGNTLIVVACALSVVISLIAALSFVVNLPTRTAPQT